MSKNPIVRNKNLTNVQKDCNYGNIWGEIDENVDIINSVSGGTYESTALITLGIYIGYEKLSIALGNPGDICTATVECQNNCRA